MQAIFNIKKINNVNVNKRSQGSFDFEKCAEKV